MNVSTGDWQGLSSSVAPCFKMYGFIRKRVFQKSIRSLAMNSIFTVLFPPPQRTFCGGFFNQHNFSGHPLLTGLVSLSIQEPSGKHPLCYPPQILLQGGVPKPDPQPATATLVSGPSTDLTPPYQLIPSPQTGGCPPPGQQGQWTRKATATASAPRRTQVRGSLQGCAAKTGQR